MNELSESDLLARLVALAAAYEIPGLRFSISAGQDYPYAAQVPRPGSKYGSVMGVGKSFADAVADMRAQLEVTPRINELRSRIAEQQAELATLEETAALLAKHKAEAAP